MAKSVSRKTQKMTLVICTGGNKRDRKAISVIARIDSLVNYMTEIITENVLM